MSAYLLSSSFNAAQRMAMGSSCRSTYESENTTGDKRQVYPSVRRSGTSMLTARCTNGTYHYGRAHSLSVTIEES